MRESAQQEEGGHNPGHWGRGSLGRRKEKTDCEHPTMFPKVTHGPLGSPLKQLRPFSTTHLKVSALSFRNPRRPMSEEDPRPPSLGQVSENRIERSSSRFLVPTYVPSSLISPCARLLNILSLSLSLSPQLMLRHRCTYGCLGGK